MRTVPVTILILLLFVWLEVEGTVFPHGPKPAISKAVEGVVGKTKDNSQKRVAEDINAKLFRNNWVVEFNDVLSFSHEEFAEDHDVIVRRIGDTNLYTVRTKTATYGVDKVKEATLSSDPRVRSIEFQVPHPISLRQIPTTDPGLCSQWHMFDCPEEAPSVNINILPAWEKGYTGSGVQVAIVDDGVQYTHVDLIDAYISLDSYDYTDDDADPAPDIAAEEFHGTACAGLAVARTNSFCGVGSGYGATLSALRIPLGSSTDDIEATFLTHKPQNNAIYSNSWGPTDNGKILAGPGPLTRSALSSTSGRGGKGNIYVWAAGNGRQNGDQSTKDGYTSHPNVISVAALEAGGSFAEYSEAGASVFISAPGGDANRGIYTTDIAGSNGYSATECTSDFDGTSAATPIVSGAIAVILEANPDLTARDVRRIVGLTARKNDIGQLTFPWFRNGANHWVSYNYGFGVLDVDKAVEAAKIWKTLPELQMTPAAAGSAGDPIPSETPECYIFPFEFNVTLEYIYLTVDITHTCRGDVVIDITSPSGTNVVLLRTDGDCNDNIKFTFYTPFFMDEPSAGDWKICFLDFYMDSDSGTLNSYQFGVSGRPLEPTSVTTATVDSTSDPWLGQDVNVTITFTNADNGVFDASIDRQVIKVGARYPVEARLLSSTLTSVTAVFTVDTTLPEYGVGSFDITITDVSVQDRMLKYTMRSGDVIGTLDLVTKPPQAVVPVSTPVSSPVDAPTSDSPASSPLSNTPATVTPTNNNTPVKTPSILVSKMSSNSAVGGIIVSCVTLAYLLA